MVNVAGVICIGNSNYGVGGYVEYGGYSIHMHGYRFTPNRSNETLTIDSINVGGSDGSKNVAITEIYGLF